MDLGRETRYLSRMKSAYELAMERLGKTSPGRTLTNAQKAELAELDSIYKAKLAQAELSFRDDLNAAEAAGDFEKAEKIREQFSAERAKIESDRQEKKDRVREGK